MFIENRWIKQEETCSLTIDELDWTFASGLMTIFILSRNVCSDDTPSADTFSVEHLYLF